MAGTGADQTPPREELYTGGAIRPWICSTRAAFQEATEALAEARQESRSCSPAEDRP
jgi:hypothetical protein